MVLHKNLTDAELNLHIPKVHTHLEVDVTDLDKYTQAEIDAMFALLSGDFVLKAGDTMTGLLEMDWGGFTGIYGSKFITFSDGADATKIDFEGGAMRLSSQDGGTLDTHQIWIGQGRPQYVDETLTAYNLAIDADLAGYLPLAGGTMTGPLVLQDGLFADGSKIVIDWDQPLQAQGVGLNPPRNLVEAVSSGYKAQFGNSAMSTNVIGLDPRPTYNSAELALLSDVGGGGGDAVLRDGTLPLTAEWDAGPFQIRASRFYADGAGAPLIVTSATQVTNLNADYLDGEHASAFADASHTHLESDITDLQTYLTEAAADLLYSLLGHTHAYAPVSHTHLESQITDLQAYLTEAAADLLYSLLGHTHSYAPISHTHTEGDITDLGDYLLLTGGTMNGDINFSDDGSGIKFWDGDADHKSAMRISDDQLVIGDDLTSGDPWEIWIKAEDLFFGYAGATQLHMYDSDNTTYRNALQLDSGGYALGDTTQPINIRGSATRPTYNGAPIALLSDV